MTRREHRVEQVVVHAVLVLACAFAIYPVLLVLKKALSPGQQFDLSLSPIPGSITLAHFRDVITASDPGSGHWLFGRQLLNSFLVAGATTLLGVSASCTAAYALSRHRFPGRQSSMGAFLAVQMFPATLLLIPLYVLLDRLGLLNRLLGLTLVYSTTAIPFCVWTLKGYFDTLPRELEEAARIDGAGPFGVFFRVVLPLSRPAIAVTALFSFMTAWNEFILAGTFMTQQESFTLPVLIHQYVGQYDAEWGHFAAGAILVSLPVMILFYALQKHLVSGLTAGGVKG